MFDLTLAAVSIQRRSAAIAIFRKTHLEEMLTRQFPNDQAKAENAIIGFVRQVLERNRVGLVAIEAADAKSDRIGKFWQNAREVFHSEGIPVQEVRPETLYQSFAVPPLRNRDQLRKIAQSIWPELDNPEFVRAAIDAAVLGLHVQTERLFTINAPQS